MEIVWENRLKFLAEGYKLRAEDDKLRVEGYKLSVKGSNLWTDAIISVHGDIKIEWVYRSEKDGYACKLETGEIFEP